MASRVLVIDDNVDLSLVVAQILESTLGAEVSCAPDGREGLALARKQGFEVAIVDVKLPDQSGVELIRPLRACAPLGELIIVTGHATVDTAISALRAGAFAFLLKTFRPEELVSTVQQALAKVALKCERELLERRHRALVDGADVLIVGLTEAGNTVLLNPRAAELAHVRAVDALGEPFAERFVASAERTRWADAMREACRAERAVEVEVGYLDGAGGALRVRWHLSAVREGSGKVELVYGIGLDVTERRALERRAADAEALATMGSLALGLAHEIRNPLNAAVLQLHLLSRRLQKVEDGELRATMQGGVRVVEGEIARLSHLLNDFLELARPREPKRERVDLVELARTAVELQADIIARHGIDVSGPEEGGVLVEGDPEKLRVVLANLVANALDAMASGGRLSVEVRREGAAAVVEVGDTGPGIDPNVRPEIFDPFFTTKEAGTGLGLSIVRKIVGQHRGKVDIETAPGRGTRVRVELPVGEAPSAA